MCVKRAEYLRFHTIATLIARANFLQLFFQIADIDLHLNKAIPTTNV